MIFLFLCSNFQLHRICFLAYQKFQNFGFIASRWRLQGTRTNTGDMSISTLQWWLCFPICVSIYIYIHRCFQIIWIPQNGWFIMENLIKMDDLWVPLFLETPIYNYNYWLIHYLQFFWEWHHWSETSFWRVKLPSPEGTLISSSLQRIQSHEWHIGAVLVQDRGWCGWHQSHWRYESWYLSAWHPLKKTWHFFQWKFNHSCGDSSLDNWSGRLTLANEVWGSWGGKAGSCQTMSTLDNSNMLDQSFDLYFKHDENLMSHKILESMCCVIYIYIYIILYT